MLLSLGIILLFYLSGLALKKLWTLLNLVLFSEYFRLYQRGLITVITGALIISVLSGAVKVGNEEIYEVAELNETIEVFTGSQLQYKLDDVVEFSQILIFIDCTSLAVISKVHSSTVYRFFFTFTIFLIITSITASQSDSELNLQMLISMFFNLLISSSAYFTTTSGLKAMRDCFEASPYSEIQQNTRVFMIFSASRLTSRSIEYFQPNLPYLVFEILHVIEALIYTYALFAHQLPACRHLRQEYDDVKSAFKGDLPEKMKIVFPNISLENQDVHLWFGALQENGQVKELDFKGPFNWKTTRVPFDFQEKFGVYLNPGTPPTPRRHSPDPVHLNQGDMNQQFIQNFAHVDLNLWAPAFQRPDGRQLNNDLLDLLSADLHVLNFANVGSVKLLDPGLPDPEDLHAELLDAEIPVPDPVNPRGFPN